MVASLHLIRFRSVSDWGHNNDQQDNGRILQGDKVCNHGWFFGPKIFERKKSPKNSELQPSILPFHRSSSHVGESRRDSGTKGPCWTVFRGRAGESLHMERLLKIECVACTMAQPCFLWQVVFSSKLLCFTADATSSQDKCAQCANLSITHHTFPFPKGKNGVQISPRLRMKLSNDWESRWIISATLPKLALWIFAVSMTPPPTAMHVWCWIEGNLSLGNQRPWATGWRNQAMSLVSDTQEWRCFQWSCGACMNLNAEWSCRKLIFNWRGVWISVLLCKSQGNREVWVKLHNSEEQPYAEGQITHLRFKFKSTAYQRAVCSFRLTTSLKNCHSAMSTMCRPYVAPCLQQGSKPFIPIQLLQLQTWVTSHCALHPFSKQRSTCH